jgi:hypothetical protein
MDTRQPIVILTKDELVRVMEETGSNQSSGSAVDDKSFVFAPLVSGDAATGCIVVGRNRSTASRRPT